MYQWHAKVHRTGSRVAIFNGPKLVRVVEASKDTYEPAEAQKFAEELISELQGRTSAQMSEPGQQPSVTTDAELKNDAMSAVNQQATGKGAGEAAPAVVEEKEDDNGEKMETEDEGNGEDKFASENANLRNIVSNLKKKLAQERNERAIERKARRGLAIAKQLVAEGKLEDSYDAIKVKIAEIVKLEDSEIERLERKVAGEHEFVSIEDAQKELRRQARISRINRQAAAEAQEDGDEAQADSLDKNADIAEAKMAHIEQVIEEMSKAAETEEKGEGAEAAETEKKDEGSTEEEKVTPAEEVEEEKLATAETEGAESVETEEKDEGSTEEAEEEKCSKASNNANEKLAALAREYRSIAANHRKLAEEAEVAGDIEAADAQDAMGDDAEAKAEDIEKKLAEADPVAEEEKDEGAETEEAGETGEKEEGKESSKKEPGKTVTSSEHKPLKRDDSLIEESSFGVDKNASLVEENDYSGDPEVDILSKMWRGAPKDDE